MYMYDTHQQGPLFWSCAKIAHVKLPLKNRPPICENFAHNCAKIAVTWAIFQKFAHLWASENFTRPQLCHSPIQKPLAHFKMKFAHFMGGKMLMV